MNIDENSMRSGVTAAIFFTTLSSVTTIAIALLPFIAWH